MKAIPGKIRFAEPAPAYHLGQPVKHAYAVLALFAILVESGVIAIGHRRAADRPQRIEFIVDAQQQRGVLLVEILRDRGTHRRRYEVIFARQLPAEAKMREPG